MLQYIVIIQRNIERNKQKFKHKKSANKSVESEMLEYTKECEGCLRGVWSERQGQGQTTFMTSCHVTLLASSAGSSRPCNNASLFS